MRVVSAKVKSSLLHFSYITENKSTKNKVARSRFSIPVAPVSPLAPFVPCHPMSPGLPVAPVAPSIPVDPTAPGLPFAPMKLETKDQQW